MKTISYFLSLVAFCVTTLYYLMPKTFDTDVNDLLYGSLVCIMNFLIYILYEIRKNK
jgi:uncharacterized BrkB/YihY/UPF0761 family membrane protein